MSNVIDFQKYKEKKATKSVNLYANEPISEETQRRLESIRDKIQRINEMMAALQNINNRK